MPTIENYEKNLEQVLADAAQDPSIRKFIEQDEMESRLVDLGDGSQAQVQALSLGAVRRVINRILAEAHNKGSDIKNWICSAEEKGGFDLCNKLNDSGLTASLMRHLYAFLTNKWNQGGQQWLMA